MKNKIGIIGGGFVGDILKKYYPDAKVYDIDPVKSKDKLEDTIDCQYVFIALNFVDNCISESNLDEIFDYCSLMKDGTVVIIKSTFVPGTTDKIQDMFPDLKVIYNPEFLTELTAWEDFSKPQFQILGCTYKSLDIVHDLFSLLPDAPIKRVISPLDAEMLKHVKNSYYALKVAWFNQIYDACEEIGSDYETVREILMNDPWVGNSHSAIFHKGYRGYGGKCLSKDPKNLAKVVKFPIINNIEEYNEKLRNL